MRPKDIKIDIPKTSNPFRLGQYILKLVDVIKELRQENKSQQRQIQNLQQEIEELKKFLITGRMHGASC